MPQWQEAKARPTPFRGVETGTPDRKKRGFLFPAKSLNCVIDFGSTSLCCVSARQKR